MGCGRTGAILATSLVKRGHRVVVIDIDPTAFRLLPEDFDGKTVTGVGFDRAVLERADIASADGFAAVSSGDNSNILAARVVREVYGVTNVVARIYDQGRAAIYERLGINTVAPVQWSVAQVMRRLLPEGSEPVWRDPSSKVVVIEVHIHHGWVGRKYSELSAAARAPIPLLRRLGRGMIPAANTVHQDGDLVYMACEADRIPDIESLFASPPTTKHP